MLSLLSVIRASRNHVTADLDGEAVILDIGSGVYYGLDETGAYIWSMIQEPRSLVDVRSEILQTYEVEPDECERDLVALLEQMIAAGLVEVLNGAGV